jgi:hypothetical protein
MRKRFTVVIVLFYLTLQSGISQDKKTIQFVDNYLKSAIWSTAGIVKPITKWPDTVETINYKIVGDLQFMSEKSLKKYLLEIESLTNKKLLATESDNFQILIFFGELKDYAALTNTKIPLSSTSEFTYWSSRDWDKSYNLTKASYCIVPSQIKDPKHGIYYLKRAILNSLGILGEADSEYSIFHKSPNSYNASLSKEDKRFIKLHYNQAIKAGIEASATKKNLLRLDNIEQMAKEKL